MKKRDLYYERIPTKLLREDIRHLGTTLGEVIKDQEGIKFFNLVEKVRKLSKANKINLKSNNSFKKFSNKVGVPDGMTLDNNKNLWVAHYHGACISVFNSKGKLIHRIQFQAKTSLIVHLVEQIIMSYL